MKKPISILVFVLITNFITAQNEAFGGESPINYNKSHECLSEERREVIFEKINQNRKVLIKKGLLKTDSRATTLFQWPIMNSEDNEEFASYGISNYVDHNPESPNQLSDYLCGTKTYDTANGYDHQGIDVYLWPFQWHKMEHNQVAVVAAAAGIVIYKEDGNYDKSCNFNSNPWNAVYIQHADGSLALYGHLKDGEITEKVLGQSVSQGEILGYVGSSGNSTGPHLHFEVFDAQNNLIDPYSGPCNDLNNESWWEDQKPYLEPQINAMYIHSSPPDFGVCPQIEDVDFMEELEYNTTYNFATYYHDQRIGDPTAYKIIRPDGSIFQQWTHNSPNSYYSSYWYWNITFLSSQPPGEWTFEAVYEDKTYFKNFILDQEVTSTNYELLNDISAYPNPFNQYITLTNCKNVDVKICTITGKSVNVKSNSNGKDKILDFSNLPDGVYLATLKNGDEMKCIKLYRQLY